MKAFGLTHVGLKRSINQDAFFINTDRQLFAVADGMGGHKAGELASKLTLEAICDYLEQESIWEGDETDSMSEDEQLEREASICQQAIKYANQIIFEKANESIDYQGMGTTIVLLKVLLGHAIVAHVGDSRIYRITDEKIYQLTKDHSRIQELIDQERITPAEANRYPLKNVITRAIGGASDVQVDASIVPLGNDDVFLLCTDGLSGVLDDQGILELVIDNPGDPEESCRRLIQCTLDHGAPDNVTVIVSDTRAYSGNEPKMPPPPGPAPAANSGKGTFRRFLDRWFKQN